MRTQDGILRSDGGGQAKLRDDIRLWRFCCLYRGCSKVFGGMKTRVSDWEFLGFRTWALEFWTLAYWLINDRTFKIFLNFKF
jgi:hypothetical protein